MAIVDLNYELKHLLKMWGIELDNFEQITITIRKDSLVVVKAIHHQEKTKEVLDYMAKEYALVELKNE